MWCFLFVCLFYNYFKQSLVNFVEISSITKIFKLKLKTVTLTIHGHKKLFIFHKFMNQRKKPCIISEIQPIRIHRNQCTETA